MLLVPNFATLLRRFPGLALEMVVRERIDDLVAERLDLALRFSQPADTSLMSRAIATVAFISRSMR